MSEITVLIPSYNHAPFIERALRSVFAQTFSPKKLIVIDDGSKDESIEIIGRVLRDCPFENEFIRRENRGLCATLNEGLAKSSGEFFAYIGSDDFWLPTFLEERTKLLSKRKNAVLGYGHSYFVNENDEIIDNSADHTEIWANYPDGDAREMLLKGIAPISSTIFYRRDFLKQVSWNENSRLEDYEMYLKLAALGDFAFDPQVLSAWRQHGYNTSKDRLLMLEEVLEAQKRNFDVLQVSEGDLKKVQTETKFLYARDLLQHGDKRNALRLALENWHGANSKRELAKFFVRLFVPMFVVDAKRKLRKEKYLKKIKNVGFSADE